MVSGISMSESRQALMATYAPPEVVFTRGQGSYLYTEDNTKYLDFISGIAVNAMGHCHPYLVELLTKQAGSLWHASNLYRVPEAERLAQRLCDLTFADKVFFNNSGAEAVECGLKTMRRYHHDNGHEERYRIIGTHQSFHGRTIATVCAAGNPSYTKGFVKHDQGYDHVPFEDLEALKTAITPETAGIIVEPIQGEGGIRPASKEYLRAVRDLADEHGILLMFDEVQCGMGRTGKLFAYQWSDVLPDVLASAKGLGGGFPVGACLATDKVAAPMVVGTHGSTFGGNPLAMTVANGVLDLLIDQGVMANVDKQATALHVGLTQLAAQYPQHIEEIRGQGLMLGIKASIPNIDIVNKARDYGLLLGKAGDNVVRLLPPLVIGNKEVQACLEKLDQTLMNLVSESCQ